MKPARGGRHLEREGYGLVVFASVMLLIIGCFNLIYGIAAVANAHVFVAGCLGLALNASESTSPGRTLPEGAGGCLQDRGEWLPLWVPLTALSALQRP